MFPLNPSILCTDVESVQLYDGLDSKKIATFTTFHNKSYVHKI